MVSLVGSTRGAAGVQADDELSSPSENYMLHSSVLRGLCWQHSLVAGWEEASGWQALGEGGKEKERLSLPVVKCTRLTLIFFKLSSQPVWSSQS